MKNILIWGIKKYQKYLSPDHSIWAKKMNKPPYCRYYPSCSEYSKVAIERHGTIKGLYLSIHRIFRCNPWGKGGIDYVPENKSSLRQPIFKDKPGKK